jgi:predicted peptidase
MHLDKPLKRYKKLIWKSQNNDTLNYRFREPKNLKKKCKYPILFFMHGAGGRGSNNNDQLLDAEGFRAFSNQNIFSKHSSYILAPHTQFSING